MMQLVMMVLVLSAFFFYKVFSSVAYIVMKF